MRIEINDKDIKTGRPRQGDVCALALAIHRHCPSLRFHVSSTDVLIYDPGKPITTPSMTVPLPADARLFVRKFDTREPVFPTAFEIEGL